MSAQLARSIPRGIPPDQDHLELMRCCFGDCQAAADTVPLIVAAFVGKMVTLCRYHYDWLTHKVPP